MQPDQPGDRTKAGTKNIEFVFPHVSSRLLRRRLVSKNAANLENQRFV
jgi:hypothetical protein